MAVVSPYLPRQLSEHREPAAGVQVDNGGAGALVVGRVVEIVHQHVTRGD
jgi:hypothetical protein